MSSSVFQILTVAKMLLKIICTILIINAYISFSDCTEAMETNHIWSNCPPNHNGTVDIIIAGHQTFKVLCKSGWAVILERKNGSVEFNRNWTDYKNGFGNFTGDFFLGLDKIHALTTNQKNQLTVQLKDNNGQFKNMTYDHFSIGNETASYVLQPLSRAYGDAGDSFTDHVGQRFSTFDRDNDSSEVNCAESFTGGWWYNDCYLSHLTGKYGDNTHGRGIIWNTFNGHDRSLKEATMLIRPKKKV